MRNALMLTAAGLMLAACQPATSEGDASGDAARPATSASSGAAEAEAPPAFVGRWAAEASWCANTLGPERPVEVTATEFRGYENICQITDLATVDVGWTATFVCQAEGETTSQPVQIEASAERLKLTWQDDGYDVEWRRCPS